MFLLHFSNTDTPWLITSGIFHTVWLTVDINGHTSVVGFPLAHFFINMELILGSTFSGDGTILWYRCQSIAILQRHATEWSSKDLDQQFSNLRMHQNHLRASEKKNYWVLLLECWFRGSRKGPIICISNKFPKDTGCYCSRGHILRPMILKL